MFFKNYNYGILIIVFLLTCFPVYGEENLKETLPSPVEAYNKLLDIDRELNYIGSTISLLAWDKSNFMPPDGAEYRGKLVTYFSNMSYEKMTDPEFGKLLSIAEKMENQSDVEKANLHIWRRYYDKEIKLPHDFVSYKSEVTSKAIDAWKKGREENDYSIFQHHLKLQVDISKETVEYMGYDSCLYNGMLDFYVEGLTVEECDKLFEELKPSIIALLKKIKESDVKIPDILFPGNVFPEEKQKELLKTMSQKAGYDLQKGFISKTSLHPETTVMGPEDVRITTRFDETNPFSPSLRTGFHEAGHAIYFQNLPEEYSMMPAGFCAGTDLSEGIARYYENHISKNMSFWTYWLPEFKHTFSIEDNISSEDIYRYVNRVSMSPLRLEADELTYVLHIIIRYEIERDLFSGKITADDLPSVWKEKYKEYTGIDVTDDKSGILQDIHWATGGFGYFPSYVIGSIEAAQLDAAMRRDCPDLDRQMASGDFSFPLSWMKEHIYKYGAVYTSSELVKKATGKELTSEDFINYLNNKYRVIYELDKKRE